MKLSDTEQVDQHISTLDSEIALIIQTIRQLILAAHESVGERIKWNNPSFYYTGEMAPFDPKEYKREIAVFNLFKNRIMLVFPSGSKIKNTTGLLEGDFKDGRRTIIFKDANDVQLKAAALKNIITEWIELID
jgi:hypothetical protein